MFWEVQLLLLDGNYFGSAWWNEIFLHGRPSTGERTVTRVDEQRYEERLKQRGTHHRYKTGPDRELVDFMLLACLKWNIMMLLLFRDRSGGGVVLQSVLDHFQHHRVRDQMDIFFFRPCVFGCKFVQPSSTL